MVKNISYHFMRRDLELCSMGGVSNIEKWFYCLLENYVDGNVNEDRESLEQSI